ncbi:MAG TPA: lipopolysaccharide ABC transporter ATP-binding protein, partial [Gammaproteobacteria bacterium]|nr:lipopolysaccharide ABC transporter ATP-binding protein [Gammaproteobacteria bacterium]
MPLLSVQQLSKQFNGRKVVKDSSLTLSSGEVIGLLGPNGAGKTTTFYMIVGLIAADTGKIFLDNLNITRYPIHQRAQLGIGYLPQEPSIFRQLSVADNILAILQTRRDINKRVQHHILEQLLDDFNLTAIRDSIGISLSGGERR